MPTCISTHTRPHRVRHECKFVVPPRNLSRVKSLLDHVCAVDPTFEVNVVKSLYFDTNQLALLRQKQASEFLKRKVRIRWYVDPQSGTTGPQAFLEVKTKNGARGSKQRTPLPIPASQFNRNPLAAVESLFREMDTELTTTMRGLAPTCIIQYHRHRYTEIREGFRISLDSEIRALSLHRMWQHGLRESRPSYAILEVKGSGARRLPASLSKLHRWGVQKAAFSKYAACLDQEHPLETNPR